MPYKDILLEISEHIAIITINRPDVLNALRSQTKQELSDALDTVATDDNIHGLIITGAGRAFISGSDVSEISIDKPGDETKEMSARMHALLAKLAALPKPVIAAINGYALGGGLELALACDLRVCCEGAKVGLPEIDLGVLPCYGGTQRLPRVIGAGLSKELLFTGRMMTAEEALQVGLVNRILQKETLVSDAEAWMRMFIEKSAAALKYAKVCVDDGLQLSLQDGLALESKVAGILVETPEAKEKVTAFLEKRKAKVAAKAVVKEEQA